MATFTFLRNMLKDIDSMNHFTKRFMYKYSIFFGGGGGGRVKNMFPRMVHYCKMNTIVFSQKLYSKFMVDENVFPNCIKELTE